MKNTMKLDQKDTIAILSIIVSAVVAIVAILATVWIYLDSQKPKENKMTVKTNYKKCFNDNKECSQLFIYNNDEAPCFDMTILYNASEYSDVSILQDFNRSSLLYAQATSNGYEFPAMERLPLKRNDTENEIWFGFLPNKTPVYFAFYPYNPEKTHTIKIQCTGDKPIEYELAGKK